MSSFMMRVEALERRMAAVEQALGIAADEAPEPRREPVTEPEQPAPAPVEAPQLPLAPRPKPPRPRRSLEVDVGRWLLSRAGALALVVAAGFLFHYTVRIGLLGPKVRLILGALVGAGLVAAGEWQSTRLRQFSGALSGAGVAILYVCVYAGYGLYGFYPAGVALGLVALLTLGGVAQALRHRIEAIAGLAAIGGFLAPVLVLDPFAQPVSILLYLLVLNAGLCSLRMATGWISAEVIAWLGTAVCAPLALTKAPHGWGLTFLLAYVTLFSVRPRLRPGRGSPALTLLLAAVTTLVSWGLFEIHDARGWPIFIGGLAAVQFLSAYLTRRRAPNIAATDLIAGAAMALLALLDGLTGWKVTLGWSMLGAGLALVPSRDLRRTTLHLSMVVAALALARLGYDDITKPVTTGVLVGHLAVAGALAAIRSRAALWAAVTVAGLGFAIHLAYSHGRSPWLALLMANAAETTPTLRLLCATFLAAPIAAFAAYVKQPRVLFAALAYIGAFVLADLLYVIDRVEWAPPGLIAALAVLLLGRKSLIPVVAALAIAVGFDLIPPRDYLPFLNRRAVAIGAVLATGWFLLRKRAEGYACALLGALLAVIEFASVPSRAGGAIVWRHLWLDMRTATDALALFNARFFFLAGAAATAFVAARRWPAFLIVGHVYAVFAIGVEFVGLVSPAVRADPWVIFAPPSSFMGEQLALTGVLLVYAATLVLFGILKNRPSLRVAGLVMLSAGALKVSLIDLSALDDLYRVGSFLVVGATFLLGSYAYNRWVKTDAEQAEASHSPRRRSPRPPPQ